MSSTGSDEQGAVEQSAVEQGAVEQGAIDAEPEVVVTAGRVIVRRSPRYFRFMALGAIVGVILAIVFTVAFPDNAQFTATQVFGFLLLVFLVVGVALGSLAAILANRIVSRGQHEVDAERTIVHPVDEP
ncbi:hypothetical protein [Compostimonas suwonensis]|uniref:Potassium transporter Trk n=1 Tax=Compostimonas suwonensis TaxID=1048394 RepID=A0A2M9C4N2_9MICO|nr:hypothetical protein [Compostimonas suwonensis]PJJ65491.1 hypothetical protein CLV54_0524 [Compostimonas suwonensis]